MSTGSHELQSWLEIPRITWPTLPDLPVLTNPFILPIGTRHIYIHSPTTLLKWGRTEEEGIMTSLAHSILGGVVPKVLGVVSISDQPGRTGLILQRQRGTLLVELWPTLSPEKRMIVKDRLRDLLVRMRKHPLDYYGRPGGRPYTTFTTFDAIDHAFCTTRTEWDESRIQALRKVASDIGVDEAQRLALEQVERGTRFDDRPVLTHGDLSDRNFLADPDTLEITGIIDWEDALVMPAHYEYARARLSGGHKAEWRKELLDVLRDVLRVECATAQGADGGRESSGTYEKELEAWNNLVDVERAAQGFSDACYWTFE
ncbi:hypothetical protein FOMPIDRAFT_1019415 [Fomitopsis schrenkii]|uniref:Aminoglycoside phosphotransferase domain-containing protein n=1 Tax=Fomitopsis schrenkii TaxID=2126942 RepID=S8F0Y1_FOMSC|nr:hypothetical protein FOMPIDRAFT_1019415 [Fomitopsis schrenkii]